MRTFLSRSIALASAGLVLLGRGLAAQNSSIRISVSGLQSTATTGGTAVVTRTDITGVSPVTVQISSSGGGSVKASPGTYSVQYSPPSGYVLASGQTNPKTTSPGSGRTGQVSWTVQVQQVVTTAPTTTTTTSTTPTTTTTTTTTTTAGNNEPAGLLLISERNFDAKVENNWTDRGDSRFTIESDATAPVSPPNVGQALYPVGWAGGSGPISTSLNLRTQPWKHLYVSFYVKFSLNWQSHSSGVNKVMFIWIHEQPTVFLNAQGVGSQPASTLTPSVNLQENMSGARRRAPNIVSNAQIVRGQWHRWELVLVSNTAGLADGIIRWYIDGVLVGDYRDADFSAAGQANDWNQVQVNPTWGGSGDLVGNDMSIRFDRIRVSGSP